MTYRCTNFSTCLLALATFVTTVATSPADAQVRGGRGGRGGGRTGGHTASNLPRPSNSGFSVSRPAQSGAIAGKVGAGQSGGSRTPNLPGPATVLPGTKNPGSNFHRPNVDTPKHPGASAGVGQQIKDVKAGKPNVDRPIAGSRPNGSNVTRPSNGPSRGQLNDFLGIDNRPEGGPGSSGAIANRLPDQKPNIDRDKGSKIGDRIGDSNRVNVGDVGNVNVGNSIEFSRDRNAWVNNIHSAGDQIRVHAGDRFTGLYHNGRYRYGIVGGYPYYAGWVSFGPYYGWRPITYVTLGTFLGATWANATPVYYAYGTGGNVYYENNVVYVNDQPAGTPAEYAAQAAAIVATAPATTDDSEWMPLGVFALTPEGVDDSQTMIELAVNKQGVIAGTYCNEATQVSRSLKGSIEKTSQRVAIGFADGKNGSLVLETGVENLTQEEMPALLHYGAEMSVPVLLVRLKAPAESAGN